MAKRILLKCCHAFCDLVRIVVFWMTRKTKWFQGLQERMKLTEVGFTGCVSLTDDGLAKERGIRPLNSLERWLLKPVIISQQRTRQKAFRQACIEVLGEDPLTDWL